MPRTNLVSCCQENRAMRSRRTIVQNTRSTIVEFNSIGEHLSRLAPDPAGTRPPMSTRCHLGTSRGKGLVTIAAPDISRAKPDNPASRSWLAVAALMAAMTTLRVIYACAIDLRTDEDYYWTWSKENVLSYLDHPPMIAWFIRFGTAIFGDTNLGVRFAGILA